MGSALVRTSQAPSLADLGRRLYESALIRREQELITGPDGEPIGWLLDTRIPMLTGPMAQEVGCKIAAQLRNRGVDQVAGYGFGAYPIVCAALGAPGTPVLRGGFIRNGRKGHGRRRIVEGPLSKAKPIVLLDDILNSGKSAMHAWELLRAEGYDVVGLMALFEFAWSCGRKTLEDQGLWVHALLRLNLREGGRNSSDLA